MSRPRVDLLVAGAGAAGLAAALSAADGGIDVIVVEARASFTTGSNTAMSTSMIPAAGSRWQARAGIDDSPERFLDDIMTKTNGEADTEVAAALTQVSAELVGWLADAVGVPLQLVTDFRYPGHSRLRCHAVADRSGRTLLSHLLTEAQRRTDVTIIVPMRLSGISLDGAGRFVATVATPDGIAEEVDAGAVVLATNGFGARPDLVAAHIPEASDALYFGGDGSTGDALDLCGLLGADTAFLDAYQGHGSVASPHGVLVTWATVMHGAVLVNDAGERFGDETVGYSEYAVPVLRQPGATAWVVLDRRIDAACRAFSDYRDLDEVGALRWAGDTAALAGIIGAPEERLAATLDGVGAAAGGAPDRWGRTDWEAPLEPPYAAVRVTGALFHTQGGLRVDADAAVLSRGRALPGLYAAGGAAAGISGHGASGYLAGNGLLAALGLGYLAGRHVASGS